MNTKLLLTVNEIFCLQNFRSNKFMAVKLFLIGLLKLILKITIFSSNFQQTIPFKKTKTNELYLSTFVLHNYLYI